MKLTNQTYNSQCASDDSATKRAHTQGHDTVHALQISHEISRAASTQTHAKTTELYFARCISSSAIAH